MADVVQKAITANDLKNGSAIVGVNKLGTIQALSPDLNEVPVLAQVEADLTYEYSDNVTFGSIEVIGDGANPTPIVNAISGRKIRVTNYTALLNDDGSIQFYSGSGVVLTGAMGIAASGGVAVDAVDPVLETNVGEAFGVVVQPSGNALNGHLTYEIV